jgi:predicted transposase/invertase (TIGR01784 family)
MAQLREEHREEGRKEEQKSIANNLLQMNMPIDTIIKATGLTEDEIKKL